jgi:hypothetical protein
MTDQIMELVSKLVGDILGILAGAVIAFVGAKAHTVLDSIKKKDQTGIARVVIDDVVKFAEAEFSGQAGIDKRNQAVEKVIEILATKGIKLSEAEIIAGIEAAVHQMNQTKMFLQPVGPMQTASSVDEP